MKRKIGEIYNKPIVEGDKNLVKDYEIHIDELSNVPTSGEGGGSASTMEYFLYEKGLSSVVAGYAQYMKVYSSAVGIKAIMPVSVVSLEACEGMQAEKTAFGVDFNAKAIMQQAGTLVEMTVMQQLGQNGISAEDIASLPRITEEQFYTL